MQHCRQFFLHGKRLHPCKMPLGVPCIVALLFERKNASAPVCRFPLGGRVSNPTPSVKTAPRANNSRKRGVSRPKANTRSCPKASAEGRLHFPTNRAPIAEGREKSSRLCFCQGESSGFFVVQLNNHAFFRSRQGKNEYASQALGCAFECGCRFQGLILGFSCVRCCREYNTAYYPAERRR